LGPTESEVREIVRRVLTRLSDAPTPASTSPAASPSANPTPARPTDQRRSGRRLIDEAAVRELAPGSRLDVPRGALVTPLARQVAEERGIRLVEGGAPPVAGATQAKPGEEALPAPRGAPRGAAAAQQRVAVGADHGGYPLKETLKAHLQALGYEVVDCGTNSADAVDYPDFAYAVAQLVASGQCANGVVVDGAGIGSCMTANKVPGVRAAMCYDHATAVNSREHNHANVLTLGAGLIGGNLAKQIVQTWLATPYGGGRHAARVAKITAIEKRFTK
jgi:ribose 5-phosphate isomerase B